MRHAAEDRRVAGRVRPDPAGDAERDDGRRAEADGELAAIAIRRRGGERDGDGGERRDDADEQRARGEADEQPGAARSASMTRITGGDSLGRPAQSHQAADGERGASKSGALVVSWRAPSNNAGAVARMKLPSSAPRRRIMLEPA